MHLVSAFDFWQGKRHSVSKFDIFLTDSINGSQKGLGLDFGHFSN